MSRYYYDFHLHSCLSPCGDNDMTPNNIAGMAKLNGLDIIALTDHNSVLNCPAFFEAAERYGIIPVAGMELTTAEDIHVVCLFEQLSQAMAFGEEVGRHRILIPNRTDIFGEQLILNGEDEVTGSEDKLLPNATDIPIEAAPALAEKFGGVCYPAHVDREANGIIATLGVFPESPQFAVAELNRAEKLEEYKEKYPTLEDKLILFSSDAHYLEDISEREHFLEIEGADGGEILRELFLQLRTGRRQ